MITIDVLEDNLKKNKIENCYIFCGTDEELIKDAISNITKKVVDEEFKDLNLIKLDGMITTFDDIMNACETFPFMGEKKAVVVYRSYFLKEKCDNVGKKLYKEILEYVKNLPDYNVLIMYYLFDDKRDTPKKNKNLMSLDKIVTLVHADKLKKDVFYKKVESIFSEQKANIGKVEVRYFCEKVYNNFDIIRREVDKLIAYSNGNAITKKDIDKLLPSKNEDDIFDLVDHLSQRKIEKALDLMDELLLKEDQHMLIISAIQNHFKRLFEIKAMIDSGKDLQGIINNTRLPRFVCEKLIAQSKRYSNNQYNLLIKIGLDTEKKLKSSSIDKRTEMEMMMFKIFMVK